MSDLRSWGALLSELEEHISKQEHAAVSEDYPALEALNLQDIVERENLGAPPEELRPKLEELHRRSIDLLREFDQRERILVNQLEADRNRRPNHRGPAASRHLDFNA